MAAQKPLTWFGGYEGAVASRAAVPPLALTLHLLDDAGEPFCGTTDDLRPVTRREAESPGTEWCEVCSAEAQKARRDVPDPDYGTPRQTLCGSCGTGTEHIEGRCRSCGGPWSPPQRTTSQSVPQLTKRERDYRAALDRRRGMLERRLAEWDPARDADRTRGELAALEWALRLIDACEEVGVLSTLRETGKDV